MNKALFEQIVAMFNSGDVSSAQTIFSEEYLDHQKPAWLSADGPQEFMQIVELARKSLPGLKVSIEGPLIAEGDLVAGRLLWVCETVERETIEILRLSDGKFVEHWGAESWSREKNTGGTAPNS